MRVELSGGTGSARRRAIDPPRQGEEPMKALRGGDVIQYADGDSRSSLPGYSRCSDLSSPVCKMAGVESGLPRQ
jgi:hypothetical protein